MAAVAGKPSVWTVMKTFHLLLHARSGLTRCASASSSPAENNFVMSRSVWRVSGLTRLGTRNCVPRCWKKFLPCCWVLEADCSCSRYVRINSKSSAVGSSYTEQHAQSTSILRHIEERRKFLLYTLVTFRHVRSMCHISC